MSLIFLVDNSLSVENYIKYYLQTINKIIENQKIINPYTLFTCVSFSDTYSYICRNSALRSISENELKPKSTTSLYDCLTNVLNNELLSNKNFVNVIILTDGDDNSSKYSDINTLSNYISRGKNLNWKFIYLGTTSLSIQISKKLGCDISILYDTNKKCFDSIPNVIENIFKGNVNQQEIDINDIINSFDNVKI